MLFRETIIRGAYIVELERRGDARGFFARMFCSEEFERRGLIGGFAQVNNSLSSKAGTLRGLHYQVAPKGEAKLVRCIAGSAYDVVVDLRAKSDTFGRWFGKEIDSENREMVVIPPGCAHGFITLSDQTELLYFASAPYSAAHERVLRWDDQQFAIRWPRQPLVISEKDRMATNYALESHASGY